MAKKQTAKQRREENNARTLAARLNKKTQTEKENIDAVSDYQSQDYAQRDSDFIIAREIFEKNKRNREWQKKMPKHKQYDTPNFLIDSEMSEERKVVAEKLFELLRTKFSLSTIADILLYNDYNGLDNILKDKREFFNAIKKVQPQFSFKFKQKVGADNSRIYSAQEKKIKALLDFLSEGAFIQNEDVHIFQDVVSSIVDTIDFNRACKIESEFMETEMDVLLYTMQEKEDLEQDNDLNDLRNQAIKLRNELQYRTDAYRTIERLVAGKEDRDR